MIYRSSVILIKNIEMKHRFTKERRILKGEFIYMHRELIKQFNDHPRYIQNPECEKWIRDVAIPAIGYSCRTNICDIWVGIRRQYNQMVKQKIIIT